MSSVPVVSSIPYIGSAFKSVREDRNELATFVLVRPEIVQPPNADNSPDGGAQAQRLRRAAIAPSSFFRFFECSHVGDKEASPRILRRRGVSPRYSGILACVSFRKAARRRFYFLRLTLPVAEGFLRLSFAAAHRKKFRWILRFIKSRVDFLFASGIKEVLEDNAISKAASQRPRVVSAVKKRVCIYDPCHRTAAHMRGSTREA